MKRYVEVTVAPGKAENCNPLHAQLRLVNDWRFVMIGALSLAYDQMGEWWNVHLQEYNDANQGCQGNAVPKDKA
jgi:hypothetical protein